MTAKSNDFKSLFGNEEHSKPYINTWMHFDLNNSKVTSSEAVLPILPNIALAERKKRLFGVIYGTSLIDFYVCKVRSDNI